MCILRYLPAVLPSASKTTAVLWYRPVARFSNSELTSTTPCCFASPERRSVLGPGIVSARSNSSTDSCRSEEHTSELQSLMRISYAVFCLKKNNINKDQD